MILYQWSSEHLDRFTADSDGTQKIEQQVAVRYNCISHCVHNWKSSSSYFIHIVEPRTRSLFTISSPPIQELIALYDRHPRPAGSASALKYEGHENRTTRRSHASGPPLPRD
jgi:hypothetical protein